MEGRRVWNRTKANDGNTWRCANCGGEKTYGESDDDKKKSKKAGR